MDDHGHDGQKQASLFNRPKDASDVDESPATQYELDAAKHALDELFSLSSQYREPADFLDLMKFIRGFRLYSPFNALLIHIQYYGALFVAPASRWRDKYRRYIRPGERPIVILQPMGPVMFVYDILQTEGDPVPEYLLEPFKVRKDAPIDAELAWMIENAKRDGVRITDVEQASGSAGWIMHTKSPGIKQTVQDGVKDKQPNFKEIPVLHDIGVNKNEKGGTRYATIAHELAHLYCGHLGTANPLWWPDRRGLDIVAREFEAEAVSWLVCGRFGLETSSDQYLSDYVKKDNPLPRISLECIVKAAGLIEQMSKGRMKLRKPAKEGA